MKDEIAIEIQRNEDSYESVLKEYYARYLTDVRNLSQSSVKHYFDALNNISRRLKVKGLVQTDIYEIGDLKQLFQARKILFADPERVWMCMQISYVYVRYAIEGFIMV